MAAIEVDRLTMSYGKVKAVDELSFSVAAGSILVMLGPNGAGKSSTIEALEGYRRPQSGKLTVVGLDPVRQQRELGHVIGVMLQQGGVNPRMTPDAALKLYSGYYQTPRDPEEILEAVELQHVRSTSFRRLSGGERQRLSLGLAIIGRPQVAFLDEPTAGVDPAGRQVIGTLISNLANDGTTVVLTTHELFEAERLADQIIILSKGQKLYDGTLTDLKAAHGKAQITFSTKEPLDLEELHRSTGLNGTETGRQSYAIMEEPNAQRFASLTSYLAANAIEYFDLSDSARSLEEIYLELTGSTPQPSLSIDTTEKESSL
ncbi:MAG: ABC transporter ATP-binding protein [Acidimicrobiales bacterium]